MGFVPAHTHFSKNWVFRPDIIVLRLALGDGDAHAVPIALRTVADAVGGMGFAPAILSALN
jgi:hypothetical protein